MPTTDQAATLTLRLSRAEEWVVHHVVLDALRLVEDETDNESDEEAVLTNGRSVLQKLEGRTHQFTPGELALIHRTCSNHAKLTSEASDRNLAGAVTDRIETVLADADRTVGETDA